MKKVSSMFGRLMTGTATSNETLRSNKKASAIMSLRTKATWVFHKTKIIKISKINNTTKPNSNLE